MYHHIEERLAPNLRRLLRGIGDWDCLEEIRLRLGKPVLLRTTTGEFGVTTRGVANHIQDGVCLSEDDLQRTIALMTDNSLYALEEEMRSGYLTLRGGHRVGLCGQVVMEKGTVKTLRFISGLNIRIARQIHGAADKILPRLYHGGQVYSTLVVSPPGCGKTTLLRDLTRQISNHGFHVVVIDERSEIAGCYQGRPQLDVGRCTDVFDGCPKAIGLGMALRGMSPQAVVTDEIGHPDDGSALADVARSGVKIIASCHGSSLEAQQRPWVQTCWDVFEQFILISRRRGPGTIEKVLKGTQRA